MPRKKKNEPAVEAAKKESVVSKYMANETLVTCYLAPEIKDPFGLISRGLTVEGEQLNANDHEWLKYTVKGKTVYSLAYHFIKL